MRKALEPEIITPHLLRRWPLPQPRGDKKARGTVLVVGGARFTPGAVLLAGLAALRAGAGRLQLAVADSTAIALSIAVPEAAVLGLPENGGELPDALLAMAGAADVIAVGPGLDDVDEAARLMAAVLDVAGKNTPVILDAYALGALSRDDGLLRGRPQPVVLTPNADEADRLLGGEMPDNLEAASVALAARHHAVVSMRGHIATPDGRLWRDENGDIGLGTSGSGDVQAGIVAGLMARGADPAQAACWGTFAHSVSGQRLIPRHGRTGFLARELVDEVAYTIATV